MSTKPSIEHVKDHIYDIDKVVELAPEPKRSELFPMPAEMLAMFEEVRANYHPHLDFSRFELKARAEAPEEGVDVIYGQVDVKSKLFPDADFVVWMALDIWEDLDDRQRHAIIDHELCHCKYTNKGEPFIYGHEIEAFDGEIERWGIWWIGGEKTIEVMMSLQENQATGKIKSRSDSGKEKSVIKREQGLDFPARDYAFVPDPLRSATWKLRLTETPGKVTETQLRRAAAALSPTGFLGNKLSVPAQTLASVKRRLKAEFRRLKIDESSIPASVKDAGEDQFMVWKDARTGLMRWFSIYSNNFRDQDNPSEIISEQSHKTYVELVDTGIVDYPELWLWHIKGTTWGKADWVAYDHGFAMASGLVYPGYEYVAKNLMKRGNLRVSHGMPKPLLLYDPHDKSTIIFHVTTEISPLPDWAAANMLTGFTVLDEGDFTMALPKAKKDFLAESGFKEETIERLDENLAKARRLATESGLESKEASTDDDADIDELDGSDLEVEDDEDIEEDENDTDDEESDDEVKARSRRRGAGGGHGSTGAGSHGSSGAGNHGSTGAGGGHGSTGVGSHGSTGAGQSGSTGVGSRKKKPMKKKEAGGETPNYATREEIAAQLIPLMQTVEVLTSHVETLTKEITRLRAEDADKIAATKEVTPTLSLADIISRNAIGKEASRVKGNTSLGKDGPKETAPVQAAPPTMVGFVNDMIALSQTGGKAPAV